MKHPQWFQYQFYDGKAFQPSVDWDYSDRKSKIEEELLLAQEQFYRGNKLDLSKTSVEDLFLEVKQSIDREDILYRAMGLKRPNKPFFNLDSLKKFNEEMDVFQKQLLKCFNNEEGQKIAFLAVLNDGDFLTHVAGLQTRLSFTIYGENQGKNRDIGKKQLTEAVNRGLNKNGNKKDNYSDILKLIQEDFGNIFFTETGDFVSNDIEKFIIGSIYDLLNDLFQGLISMGMNKDPRLAWMNSHGKYETLVKQFYKRLFRKLRDRAKIVSRTDFLQGALFLGNEFSETQYAQEIILQLYDSENDADVFEGKGVLKKDLDKIKIVDIIYNFLVSAISSFNKKNGTLTVEQALEYVKNNSGTMHQVIEEAYERQSDEEIIKSLRAFGKQAVSGIIGEIGGLIALSSDRTKPIFISNALNKIGQKDAVDIQVEIINPASLKIKGVVGVQVKNYTSKKSVPLYSGTQVSLTSEDMRRYLSNDDLKLFQFMVANSDFATNIFGLKTYEKDALEILLYNYIPQFLRTIDLQSTTKQINSFYYLNNNLVSASFLLSKILIGCLEIIDHAKKEKLFQIIYMPKYKVLKPEQKGIGAEGEEGYFKISAYQQPRATKRIGENEIENERAWRTITPKNIFPITVQSVLQKTRLKFRGITVTV